MAGSVVQRDLVAGGRYRNQIEQDTLDTVLNISVQALCMARRVAGYLDESLIVRTKENAKHVLDELEAR